MADRRKQRKRSAEPRAEAKRLSLLDLPPAVDPGADLPTNPRLMVRVERATTLPPAPADSPHDASLEMLARSVRRTAPNPEPPAPVAPAPAPRAPAAQASRSTKSRRTLPEPRWSSAPPPVQVPSEPPRERMPSGGKWGLRTLGVIVLSASVGAVVSSLTWGVKSELEKVTARDEPMSERGGTAPAAAPPGCTTTTPASEPKMAVSTPDSPAQSAATIAPAALISVDALPVQRARRSESATERVSLDQPSDRVVPATETRSTSRRAARSADARSESRRESKRDAEPRSLPDQPSRAAVSQAIARVASAATSCDGGPHDGKVTVTFAPSGAVSSVSLVKGFGDAEVNSCVLRAFGRARVPAFSGEPVQVRKSVSW